MLESLLIQAEPSNTYSWEYVATVLGVALIITEAVIRMYIHNSKMKKESKQNQNSLSEQEIEQLKNLFQTVMNNTNKISGLEIQHKNIETSVDDLKALIRDVERDNFTSLSSVSDKIDVLKNILLEAKMNSKK